MCSVGQTIYSPTLDCSISFSLSLFCLISQKKPNKEVGLASLIAPFSVLLLKDHCPSNLKAPLMDSSRKGPETDKKSLSCFDD